MAAESEHCTESRAGRGLQILAEIFITGVRLSFPVSLFPHLQWVSRSPSLKELLQGCYEALLWMLLSTE